MTGAHRSGGLEPLDPAGTEGDQPLALRLQRGHPLLADYPYVPATRADLLRRLGDAAGAAQSYRRAMELTANAAERAFLEQRLAEVSRAAGAEPAPG